MTPEILSVIVDLGFQGVLVYFISQLWAEIRDTNRYLREQAVKLKAADDERRELQEKVESLEAYRAATQSRRKLEGRVE